MIARQMPSFQLLLAAEIADEIVSAGDAQPATAYRGSAVPVELIVLGASYAGDVRTILVSAQHLATVARKILGHLRRRSRELTTLELRRGDTRIKLNVEGSAAEEDLRAAIEQLLRSVSESDQA
jgi:hypothetical protein